MQTCCVSRNTTWRSERNNTYPLVLCMWLFTTLQLNTLPVAAVGSLVRVRSALDLSPPQQVLLLFAS